MKTSRELKWMARKALSGNYGNAAGGLLVLALISFLLMIPFVIVIFITSLIGESAHVGTSTAVLAMMVMVIVYMLAGLVLMAGYVRLCYRIVTEGNADLNDLFFAVKHHFTRYLKLTLLLTLCYVLAYLPVMAVFFLLTFSGPKNGGVSTFFILGYLIYFLGLVLAMLFMLRYAMALFVLVEDPELKAREAMRRSRYLMQGNIWRMIRLQLSFFGVWLLGNISGGIGYLWVMPYVLCTNALFYLTLKEEKYPQAEEQSFGRTD